jgi:hypothetical protein
LTEELVLVKEDGTRSIPTTSDGPGATMKFEELDDDAFELRFTDPNFESVIRSGVRLSDDVLEIPLQGRGAVRVTALDARTGKPVPHVSIEVEDPIGAGDVLFTDLTPAEEIPPATSLFTGIALGAKAITVHAVGYSPATISIDPLTAGSVKPVEVRLERVVAPSPESPLEFIECTVVEADGKKPIRGARVVHCFIPDEQDEDGNRRSYESWTDMSLTDVDGNARWSRPGPGRFAFRFSGNRKYAESMSRSFVITDDLASASERVIASEGRTVRGKLTLPRGVSAAGHRVMLKLNGPVPPDLTDCVPDRPAWRDALTDADGSFVLRGVPAGTHRAYVLFAHGYSDGEAYFEERHQFPAGTLEVGRQDLDGVELGVGAEDIGGVEVSVEVEGKTSPEFARVHLISPNDSSIFRSFVNRDGLARFHALPPGSYRLVVDGVEGVDPFSVRDPVIAAWPPTRRSVKIDTR